MRKTWMIWMSLCLIFCAGCGKTSQTANGVQILEEGKKYEIALTAENVTVTGQIFFSEGGVLHFLHTDRTSPRFGMEEVFETDRVSSYFHEMSAETPLTDRGTHLLYPLVRALRAGKGRWEGDRLRFQGDDVSVILSWDGENQCAKNLEGEVCGKSVRVLFLSAA